jgi:hypothetical protein
LARARAPRWKRGRGLAASASHVTALTAAQTQTKPKQPTGNGASIKASPKKGGRGHGGWGSWKDDVDM